MGAKQSKRSVDISGKEAEGAGEVVAAGGEGRVEPLADADTLKPQLNGDAPHIQTPDEKTDKEKQLDNGTPENEKDATTEKEEKARESDKESPAVANGESEHKSDQENGESTPASTPDQDSTKKPKKEKVKKKWSLRSISFSRKDKPKQEKKQKEEEAKTNGEPEKVPEEAAEPIVENKETKNEEVEKSVENKDEKTPETPVTEPLTNGSSSPETPKAVDAPVIEETVAAAATNEKILEEPKAPVEPEQLPINGLSVEEEKKDLPEVDTKSESQESKPEEVTAISSEPAPEISVKTEVCVEPIPIIESTPPPLPANPPPSSVASFAVTTMAPHLTENTLIDNTANSQIIIAQPITTPTHIETLNNITPVIIENKETSEINHINSEPIETVSTLTDNVGDENEIKVSEDLSTSVLPDIKEHKTNDNFMESIEMPLNDNTTPIVTSAAVIEINSPETANLMTPDKNDETIEKLDNISNKLNGISLEAITDKDNEGNECKKDILVNDLQNLTNKTNSLSLNNDDKMECNGNIDINETTKLDIETPTNDVTMEILNDMAKLPSSPDDSVPPSLSDTIDSIPPPLQEDDLSQNREDNQGSNEEASESFPLPPSELCRTESEASAAASPEPPCEPTTNILQDAALVTEKLMDVPVVDDIPPEAVTLQETSNDVAVTN